MEVVLGSSDGGSTSIEADIIHGPPQNLLFLCFAFVEGVKLSSSAPPSAPLFRYDARLYQTKNFKLAKMSIKPTVALRAILVGGIAAFAKIGGAIKAGGGAKVAAAAAAAAMTAATSVAVSGSKQEQQDSAKQFPK
ncbi:hypothetical protein DM860_007295 [Cuscuta australis]|uniref:Uncharacterized protein n=2 Tax=Cuscuta sect. Cleistogrammica TaxID=1824901 RepID=A0A328E708_9ASTE|nr:hypothetical protein DM860_007295 [Cuscuta australis]